MKGDDMEGVYLGDDTKFDISRRDNKIMYDGVDWQLIKTSSDGMEYYIMIDKMSGTNIRIEYHDDAWAIRDMLKIMREDSTV